MSYTVELLNTIRNAAGTDYAARIPAATQTNITTIGDALIAYTPALNEFTSTLVEKIGLTIIGQMMANNKLKPFKKGDLPIGVDVEEIFIEMAKAEGAFDKAGANPLGRRKPTIDVNYHRMNRQDDYAASISTEQVKMAFARPNGIPELLNGIINSLYSGAEYDEYVAMKHLLGAYSDNYFDYGITAITDGATASEFVKTVRKAVADLSFVSTTYNKNAVQQKTEPKDMALLVNKDVVAEVDVEVLAKAFNMGKTDFEPTVITLDDFGAMTDTYGLLIDKDFFMVFDTLRSIESIRNPQGLFTNYFLHIWQILSLSRFKNAVRFTTSPKA